MKEIHWRNEWFSTPIGYWQRKDVQKNFLNSLAKRLGVKKAEDWGNVPIYEVTKHGGSSLLNHYGGSLQKTLKSVYPGFYCSNSGKLTLSKDIEWKPEWFRTPIGYWGNKKNQRDFFDAVAAKLQIFHPSQWGTVTNQLFIENGGRGLLILHGGSLWKALNAVYPGYNGIILFLYERNHLEARMVS